MWRLALPFCRLEGRDWIGPAVHDPAVQDFYRVIELHCGHVSLVLHHGLTVLASRVTPP